MDSFPIDPTLAPSIDPALSGASPQPKSAHQHRDASTPTSNSPSATRYTPFFDEAPEGDPFAFQRAEPQPSPPSPGDSPPVRSRRRNKAPPRPLCQKCNGDSAWNNFARSPEDMVSCIDCLKSWHPSCADLPPSVTEAVLRYDWTCSTCKRCAVCNSKARGAEMMLCESCDRGCHSFCTVPPMTDIPAGAWYCNLCHDPGGSASIPSDPDIPVPSLPQSSPAPTPQIPPTPTRRHNITKGKVRRSRLSAAVFSETGSDDERVSPRRKGKAKAVEVEEEESHSIPTRRRTHDPVPRIKLHLPRNPGRPRKSDEAERKGMFDDLLSIEDRDISKTMITGADKNLFERSRIRAENKSTTAAAAPTTVMTHQPPRPIDDRDRPLRSQYAPSIPAHLSVSPSPCTPSQSQPPTHVSGTLRIKSIRFGEYDIKTWYAAPFPEEYANIPDGRLWICEFCLKYMKSGFGLERHRMKCKARHPPGDEIYRDGRISIFEVDGRRNKIYCQNLCLLSKMFLDHKSLFYDVEPFLFYVLTEMDPEGSFGAQFIGYFSKEKTSPKNYNLSCIMTLPVRQRQGWGNFLMDFSYLLSKKEGLLGSPEKPLSSLGLLGYRTYWTLAIMRYLETAADHPRLDDICAATSMTREDVFDTLIYLGMIILPDPRLTPARPSPGQTIRVSRGRGRGPLRKNASRAPSSLSNCDQPSQTNGPFTPPLKYRITFSRDQVLEYLQKWDNKGYLKLQPEKLQWTPFLMPRVQDVGSSEALLVSDLTTSDSLPPEGDGSNLYIPPEDTPVSRLSATPSIRSLAAPSPSRENTPTSNLSRKRRGRPPKMRTPLDPSTPLAIGDPDDVSIVRLSVAEEENTPRRSTRSQPNLGLGRDTRMSHSHFDTQPTSPKCVSRASISRKRRRVESSEESEEDDDDRPSQMAIDGISNGFDSVGADVKPLSLSLRSRTTTPLPMSPSVRKRNGRKSSRLAVSVVEEEEEDDDENNMPLDLSDHPIPQSSPHPLNGLRHRAPSDDTLITPPELKMDVDTPGPLLDPGTNGIAFSEVKMDLKQQHQDPPPPISGRGSLVTSDSTTPTTTTSGWGLGLGPGALRDEDIEIGDEDAEGEIDEDFVLAQGGIVV